MTGKNLQGISFVSGFNFYCMQIFHQFLISSTVKLQARLEGDVDGCTFLGSSKGKVCRQGILS